jgi:hypothetical protein
MVIIEELYVALIEAGATEASAKAAARAVADFQEVLHKFENRLTRIEALLGINVAATVIGVFKLFHG